MFQFNAPGTFYYWSGFINSQQFSFRGVINVVNPVEKALDLNVTVNGFQGDL